MPSKKQTKQPNTESENNPRPNTNRGKVFLTEVGETTDDLSEDAQVSFNKSNSGWQPMMASLQGIKKHSVFSPPSQYHSLSPDVPYGGLENPSLNPRNKEEEKREDNTYSYNKNSKFPLRFRKNEEDISNQELLAKKELTGGFSMQSMQKRAEKRKKRIDGLYSMEEDYTVYGRYCNKPTCVGVWKELLGFDDRKKLGIERNSEVWRCPKCGEITMANGTVADQTSGFAGVNTYNNGPIARDTDFEPTKISPDKDRTKR